MTAPVAGLTRDPATVVSKSIGRRRGQQVTPTESVGAVFVTAVLSVFGLVAAAAYWRWRRR